MSRTSSGVTILGGRNDGSICGLNQDPPTPLVIPAGQTLLFTHGTGKRAYKINVTNLDAVDPVSGVPYSACNMNQPSAPAAADSAFYGAFGVFQKESAPGSGLFNEIGIDNGTLDPVACCVQIFWEVDSEELSIIQASGNADPSTDKNDPRITFTDGP